MFSGGLIRTFIRSHLPEPRDNRIRKAANGSEITFVRAFALQVAFPRLAIVLPLYRIIVWHCVLLNRDSSHDYKQHIGERSRESLRDHKFHANVLKSQERRKFPTLLRST